MIVDVRESKTPRQIQHSHQRKQNRYSANTLESVFVGFVH